MDCCRDRKERIMETDIEINPDELIMNSNFCVECYPVKKPASYILRGSSLCEKHFIKRMEYNGGENE